MNKLFKDNKYAAIGVTAFSVIFFSALSVYVIFNFGTILGLISSFIKILTPIIDGAALAYILTPVLNYVETRWIGALYRLDKKEMTIKRKRRRRSWSILVTYLLFVALLYLFFRLVMPQLILSIKSIIYQLPRYINNLEAFVTELFTNYPEAEDTVNSFITSYSIELNDTIQNQLLPQMGGIIGFFSASVVSVIKTFFNLIVGVILSVYLMYSKELLSGQCKKILYALYETKEANRMISGIRYTHSIFSNFIIGKVIDSVIIGFLTFAVTSIVGIPYAVLVSVIIGVTNLIPFFGPFIGAIPSVLLVLMIDPMKALYLLIIVIIIQQLDGNIIGPKILGDSTGLSSFWVIFSITLFGGIFGVPGMLLGVPSFAVIYALVRYKINRKLRHKDMPEATTPYINVGSIEKDGSFIDYVPVKRRSILQIVGIDKKKSESPDIITDDTDEDDDSPDSAV